MRENPFVSGCFALIQAIYLVVRLLQDSDKVEAVDGLVLVLFIDAICLGRRSLTIIMS